MSSDPGDTQVGTDLIPGMGDDRYPADPYDQVDHREPYPGDQALFGAPAPSPSYPAPAMTTGTIDVAEFVRAQAAFITEQTGYLGTAAPPGSQTAFQNLMRYSHAQTAMITACFKILHDMGVI